MLHNEFEAYECESPVYSVDNSLVMTVTSIPTYFTGILLGLK